MDFFAIIRWLVTGVTAMLVLVTMLPFLKTDAWWIRIWDFPRMQLAAIMMVTLTACVILLLWRFHRFDCITAALLVLSLAWQVYCIIPYMPFYPVALQKSSRAPSEAADLKVLIANVKFDNRDHQAVLKAVQQHQPHVVLLVEPTSWWAEHLAPLKQDYPHVIEHPQENHYGMLLYSKLELIDPQIRYLVTDDVPSIRTKIRMANGQTVIFHGLHPRPPGLRLPEKDKRVDSTQRDTELVLVGREVAELDEPVVVAGDFNDVAWSHSTALFKRLSSLLDPRVGRGLYNSYPVDYPPLRYPLDHVFVSNNFRLLALRRLPSVGSDHFPILVALSHEPDAAMTQPEPQPRQGDHEEADEQIRKAKDVE